MTQFFFNHKQYLNRSTTPLLLYRSRVARANQVREEMAQLCVTRSCARAPSVDLADQYGARRIQPQNWATFSPQRVQLFRFNHMLASRCYAQVSNLRLLKMSKTIFSSKSHLNVYNLGCFLHIYVNHPPPPTLILPCIPNVCKYAEKFCTKKSTEIMHACRSLLGR